MKIPLFNIELKDDTMLKDCVIFEENYIAIGNKELAEDYLSRLVFSHNAFIRFQNEYIQGKIHVNNVKSYEFSRYDYFY